MEKKNKIKEVLIKYNIQEDIINEILKEIKGLTPQLKYHYNRLKTDEEYLKKQRNKVNEINKNRYKNDEEYRNKLKEKKKEYYQRKKAEKENKN